MESSTVEPRKNTLLLAIIREVAANEDCDALDLPPLYDRVDPAALETLGPTHTVQFDYLGYEITVDAGTVTVEH